MKYRIKINFALEVLRTNIDSIRSVSDWSEKMGWDRATFSRQYVKMYGESAKSAFHRYKLRNIEKRLLEKPDHKYFEIACDLGFRDEKAFYDYMRYHTSQSPTSYKLNLLKKKNIKSNKLDSTVSKY